MRWEHLARMVNERIHTNHWSEDLKGREAWLTWT